MSENIQQIMRATHTSSAELAEWGLTYALILLVLTIVLKPKGLWWQITVIVWAAMIGDFYHNLGHLREAPLNFLFIIFSCGLLFVLWQKRWKIS